MADNNKLNRLTAIKLRTSTNPDTYSNPIYINVDASFVKWSTTQNIRDKINELASQADFVALKNSIIKLNPKNDFSYHGFIVLN